MPNDAASRDAARPEGKARGPLNDVACRNAACPEGKARERYPDAGGLYLEVSPSGSKRWFWKYRVAGKERRLALGSYPAVSLKQARQKRDEARGMKASGSDPVLARRAARAKAKVEAAATFEAVAREFHQTKAPGWSPDHAQGWLRALEKDVFPFIGALPLASVTAPVLLEVLRRVEKRVVRTAHDLREFSGQVFRYGIQTGRATSNPAADLRGALTPFIEKNRAALLEPESVARLLRDIHGYRGQPTTRAGLVLLALTIQRPGNVRAMEWSELDLDAATWTIPAAKMKGTAAAKANARPHLVPLPRQAVALLRELQPLTGAGRYVFPSLKTRACCLSENTFRAALRTLGYANEDQSPHGFRAIGRTLMVERLGIEPDVIEAQLAHRKAGPLGSAYDRASFIEQRKRAMQMWADYCDALREGTANVVAFRLGREV